MPSDICLAREAKLSWVVRTAQSATDREGVRRGRQSRLPIGPLAATFGYWRIRGVMPEW